ncbi:MAG: hypothetical protein DMG57_10615 [Acidobacteria bacterium]|nr:MAG: hypothetical protein DMG57_10615 [Acidobacteriota bacterium]
MRLGLLLTCLLGRIVAGQQRAAVLNPDHEIVQQLIERVKQLEAEVRELKAQRAASASAPAQAVSAPATAAQPAPEPARPAPSQTMPDAMPGPSAGFAGMQFRGFSDVQYHASDLRGETHSFSLGQFNLFITSRLSDRLSVLAEAVVEADDHNAVGIDLERLLLQYTPSDYFNVSFGRYHTDIGWYNTAYHHSTWLQTATGRPFLFEFEDRGGILPVHNVGISVNGRIPSGKLGLRYVAEIGNGRASPSRPEGVQNVHDENNGKAVNFGIMARPEWLRAFRAGFSVYRDRLTPEGMPKVGQTILAAYAVYQASLFEFLNEAVFIRNAIGETTRVIHSPGFYTQVSRRFGAVRPYFRYQYVNVPDSDPLFPGVGLRYGPSLGIRYDVSEFAAFKVQYDRTDRRRLSGFNGVTTQLSFTF